jgi:quinohemoprotein ethanol dehydrogenase
MLSMRRAAPFLLAAVLAASGLAAPATGSRISAQGVTTTPDATIDAELTLPVSDNWPTEAGNLTSDRYSTLDQINTSNVSQLKPAWMTHLINPAVATKYWSKYTQEATPIEQDGVLYIPTGNDDIFAYNAVTGAKLWSYTSNNDQKNATVCCGWDDRGLAIGQGMIFSGELDGSVLALQAATGEVLWKHQLVRWQDGYNITAAPTYYDGMIFIGTVGGEYGTRGRLYALDAATGKVLWTWYTTAAPGTVGGNSWPNDGFAYLHGGAPIWNVVSMDPSLGLLYLTTGNAGPDLYGGGRAGANLFAVSIVALHYKTGKLAWYFQEVHHDIWDLDTPSTPILFDTMYHGQLRHAIAEVGKTAFIYILDRATGKPLLGITEKAVPQYAPQATYPTQPYPVGDPIAPQCAPKVAGFRSACLFAPVTNIDTLFQPLFSGGVVWTPMTYSPQTNDLYTASNFTPFDGVLKNTPYTKGKQYTGIGALNTPLGVRQYGLLTASDASTNKIVWQHKVTYPIGNGGGAFPTAGNLLFIGMPDGWFDAYNAKTGALLWKFQMGYGATAPAMTYDVNGTQYVAIDAGGQTGAAPLGPNKQPLYGDALWVFSLKGAPNGKVFPPMPAPVPASPVDQIRGTPYRTTLVDMIDYGYAPVIKGKQEIGFGASILTVPVGTTVTFLNTGNQPHTATSKLGGWDTGLVPPGGKASVTMGKVGTFTYTCIPHPWMLGEVIVTAKGAPPPAGTVGPVI